MPLEGKSHFRISFDYEPFDTVSALIRITENTPVETDSKISEVSTFARIVVKTETGLHLRAAMRIAQICQSIGGRIELIKEGIVARGESMLDLMSLAAEQGSTLR